MNRDWTDERSLELGPTIIAVYGATSVDGDLELFVDRHGEAADVHDRAIEQGPYQRADA